MKKLALLIFSFLTVTSLFAEKTAQQKRNDLIAAAKDMLGTPYVYGGTSRSGIDCSGLIYVAARDSGNGVIPRTAKEIYKYSTRISDSERQPGDLVFFAVGSNITHVGIFLGSNQFIHSASDGPKTGVIISKLSENYWKTHYYGSGRIISAVKDIAGLEKKDTEELQPADISSNEAQVSQEEETDNFLSDYFAFTASASLNWTFIGADGNSILFSKDCAYIKGFSLQAELTAKKLKSPVSVFIRPEYTYYKDVSFPACITTSVCVKLKTDRYTSVFAGFVLNGERYSVNKPYLRGTDISLTTPFFPGLFGISVETPKFKIGKTKISLAQEASYIYRKSADSLTELTFAQAFTGGLEFNTFIRVEL